MIQFRSQTPDRGGPVRYPPGTLVRHKRYDYRGVVAAFDMKCSAPENWYRANRTQPDRNQPWYHVLVHNSAQTTYAAEDSLSEDWVSEAIVHPLIAIYFTGFSGQAYVRNQVAWGDGS